jgi:hypothetical protein
LPVALVQAATAVAVAAQADYNSFLPSLCLPATKL